MRKYAAISKMQFKTQIVYRFDVILRVLSTFWRVLFAWILWGAIYDGKEIVGGMTFQAMLSYYLISSILMSINMSEGVSMDVANSIRRGAFSKYMVIPAVPQLYFLFQAIGKSVFFVLFSVLAVIICLFALPVPILFTADPLALVCGVLMIPAGLVFITSYYYFIGILAFKFNDISFFWHMQEAVITFFTGQIIPLVLLPDAVTAFLSYLPFTYVTYMPAMLFTGQASAASGLFGLAVITFWAVAMLAMGHFTYKRLRIKYDGVGI